MIREADVGDVIKLIEMAGKFHKYSVEDKGLGFVPSDLVKYMVFLMENPIATVLVSEEEGVVVGSIAAIVNPWFMNFSDRIAHEQWWWVDPDFRGKGVAVGLLKEMEKWAKDAGARVIIMTSLHSEDSSDVENYYKNHKFMYLESNWIKEI